MKTVKTIPGCALFMMISLCLPAVGSAAVGCDKQDEERWVQMRDKLPTAGLTDIQAVIDDLTKLNAKCDPKTRFSSSVVQLLFRASFLKDSVERLKKMEKQQSPLYDPSGMPGVPGA